jgi:hypothetical protein
MEADLSKALTKTIQNAPKAKPTVVYYPRFVDAEQLTSHYHRAAWYMPRLPGVVDAVYLGVKPGTQVGEKPDFMGDPRQPIDHIQLLEDTEDYTSALSEAAMVLVWRPIGDEDRRVLTQLLGKRILVVDTDDLTAAEYGAYCKILWQLTPRLERLKLLRGSAIRYRAFLASVRRKNYRSAAVFGTGPSVDTALNFDFSRSFTHVCNTVIQSAELCDHLQPDLVSAGDVVSHFGVARYAEVFRGQLKEFLERYDAMFLTTAQFGMLFLVQYPELRDRILLCDQGASHPNYNLADAWLLPALDSVLNIHMLPSASTLFDTVFILGCDGKNPDASKNEDFWAHSSKAQNHDLVYTGHLAHPTFDKNRQESTWDRFKDSVKKTLDLGEARHGKHFYTLAQSFTPGLDVRLASADVLANWGLQGGR